MQTALHILALTAQLKSEISGSKIVATEFYKKERAAYVIFKAKQRLALGFVYHPVRWAAFLAPASKIKITTGEKPWPVFDIVGAAVTAVEQLGLDRIFSITLRKHNDVLRLVFEVLGPNGNIWLLDSENRKLGSLRKKQFSHGDLYRPSPLAEKLSPLDLTAPRLAEFIASTGDLPVPIFIERNIVGCNRTIAAEISHRAGLREAATGGLDKAAREKLTGAIEQITKSFAESESGYLYEIKGGFEAYPFKLSSSDRAPRRFKTLSLAVMAAAESRQSAATEVDEARGIRDAVRRAVRRMEKRLANIEGDIAEAADYEKYKKCGELLQVNFDKLKRGLKSVELTDIYSDSDAVVDIKLDPALSPQENAEAYFKRYRKGRDALDTLERRLANSSDELAQLRKMQADIEEDFESARKRYHQELQSLLPAEAGRKETVERLPYRQFVLSTGLKIFVGREGVDNDRTTFEFAKPYELWFHTQQCPGSHVVMKFPNKSFEPSRKEIEETAAVAAYFSKARNDSLVPVTYTQRKYVRKPRKAKPGLVTVDRVKSVMVEPARPE
ncbi:MAG: NFACT family protein [Candidatus Zixiibacteriota bacterium]|nr:MAG: NFACT family protein [candidate division Zixibacteria bacterium]